MPDSECLPSKSAISMPMDVSDLERSSHIAYNVTFNTEQVYEEYKQKVIAAGGTIKADYGSTLKVHQFILII